MKPLRDFCLRPKKRRKMKKQYSKPEAVSVNFVVSNFLATSGNKIPVTPEVKPSAAGSSRGEWGNLW